MRSCEKGFVVVKVPRCFEQSPKRTSAEPQKSAAQLEQCCSNKNPMHKFIKHYPDHRHSPPIRRNPVTDSMGDWSLTRIYLCLRPRNLLYTWYPFHISILLVLSRELIPIPNNYRFKPVSGRQLVCQGTVY